IRRSRTSEVWPMVWSTSMDGTSCESRVARSVYHARNGSCLKPCGLRCILFTVSGFRIACRSKPMKPLPTVWMGALMLVALAGAAAGQQQDARECKDHPLFTRMPGYWIHSCVERQFDAFDFIVGPNKKTSHVEGQLWK